MKNEKGITLIIVIITIILLTIIAGLGITNGMETYEKSRVIKFETSMKMIQKKVDIIMEEKIDYTTIGEALTGIQQSSLQDIINNDTNNYIETDDVTATTLRFFSESDIERYFDIEGINDEIVINFANREVISLNGVEKDGVTHYVEIGLHQ